MESGTLWRRIGLGLVAGVIVYAAFLFWSDARELGQHLRKFPLSVFAAALGLTLVNYLLRFAKWHWYLRELDVQVPYLESAVVFVAGMVMAVTPGKVGEVLKSFLLRRSRGIPAARTAPVVVAERVTDLLGMIGIAAVGAVVFDFGQLVLGGTALVLVAAIAVLHRPDWMRPILDLIGSIPGLTSLESSIEEAYESMRGLLGLRLLAGTTLLSIVAWSMEGAALYLILDALDASGLTVYGAFFVYSSGTVLGAVSFLPGGLGVAEGSMIGVMHLFDYFPTRAPAVLATYIVRFATLWFGVGLGCLALVTYRMVWIPDANDSTDPTD
ncbi:MAG: YbhN family protein [Bradymonadaceae bacterium]